MIYLFASGFSWWLEIFVQATGNTWECLSPPWEERFTKPDHIEFAIAIGFELKRRPPIADAFDFKVLATEALQV